MLNVQNYILGQRVENTVKKQRTTWTSERGFFVRQAETQKLKTADELNVLICRFMMDIEKKDGGT